MNAVSSIATARPVPQSGVRRGLVLPEVPTAWQLSAFSGRFGEVSGNAALTLAFRLVLEAQQQGEPVAWIARQESVFFPPDAVEAGIDLDALAVVRVSRPLLAARAADHLLRSGAFGLLVMDLGLDAGLPLHAQTRLAGLSKKHETALVCITEKETDHPSIGSLVSLRAQAARRHLSDDRYRCEARILKDKRRGPGWVHAESCRAPDGLC